MEDQLKIINFPSYTDTQKQYNEFKLILKNKKQICRNN